MITRLGIGLTAMAALLAAGCGSNASTGLDEIELKPDLEPVDVDEQIPLSPVLDASVTFKVSISNAGGVGSRQTSVRGEIFYLFSPGPPVCPASKLVSSQTQELPRLLPGDAISIDFKFNLPPDVINNPTAGFTGCNADPDYTGSWIFVVTTDPEDDIDEIDEGNNGLTHSFNAAGGGSGAGGEGTPVSN